MKMMTLSACAEALSLERIPLPNTDFYYIKHSLIFHARLLTH
jgi:hypothetical protein